MPRHKKGNKISGWLVVDKPRGMGSTQVVSFTRRLFNAQKNGHCGTLDPLQQEYYRLLLVRLQS